MIRTLIIEDEEAAAARVARMLYNINKQIEIAGMTDTIDSSVRWLESNPVPDLIILDIQLGDGISFEIFRRKKINAYVIFTTAYDEYAIKAFELNSIDYLLKPFSEEKLARSIDKFFAFRQNDQSAMIGRLLESFENKTENYRKRFMVSIGSNIRVVDAEETAFFYSSEKNTFLCTLGNKFYPLEYSLDQIEEMINPAVFFRVNRQYIINMKAITKMDLFSKSRIKIHTTPSSPDEILVSSGRTPAFRQWLDK